ncbi:MAG: hypothetical protein AAF517_25235, partial [Planctomycetota bacterium]
MWAARTKVSDRDSLRVRPCRIGRLCGLVTVATISVAVMGCRAKVPTPRPLPTDTSVPDEPAGTSDPDGTLANGDNLPAPPFRKPSFEPMTLEAYKAAYPEIEGLDCGIDTFFDKYINVFGVTIAAMPNTPVPEIIHAAKIYAQLLDSDQDFVPDDENLLRFHRNDPEGRQVLIVLVDTKALDNAWIAFEPCQEKWVPAQALRPGHSGVGHARDGEADIAVEELFHRYGKSLQSVYPDDFGLPDAEAGDTWSSTLSLALDAARGLDRSAKPIDGKWVYPDDAWYTYDATSCGWGCMIDEYFWCAWATSIGYQSLLTRAPGVPPAEARPRGWCE